MKILCLAGLFLMTLAPPGAVQRTSESRSTYQTEQELRDLTTKFDDALVAKDFDTLKHILSDHYTILGVPRNNYFSMLKPDDTSYEFIRRKIVRVSVYGDMAVVAGGLMQRGGSRGVAPYTSEFSFADVWARLDGRWQCVSSWLRDASNKQDFRAPHELKASLLIFFKRGATEDEIKRLFTNIQLVLELRGHLVKHFEQAICEQLRIYPPLKNHERMALRFCETTDKTDRDAISAFIKESSAVYKVMENVAPIEITNIDE